MRRKPGLIRGYLDRKFCDAILGITIDCRVVYDHEKLCEIIMSADSVDKFVAMDKIDELIDDWYKTHEKFHDKGPVVIYIDDTVGAFQKE